MTSQSQAVYQIHPSLPMETSGLWIAFVLTVRLRGVIRRKIKDNAVTGLRSELQFHTRIITLQSNLSFWEYQHTKNDSIIFRVHTLDLLDLLDLLGLLGLFTHLDMIGHAAHRRETILHRASDLCHFTQFTIFWTRHENSTFFTLKKSEDCVCLYVVASEDGLSLLTVGVPVVQPVGWDTHRR